MSTPIVDRHEAKIKSITMEAPEGYEFGHIVKAEVEMRVASYVISTDKEGNVVRTAILVVEGCHIKDALDPATAYANAGGLPSGMTDDPDDDDDDDDDDDAPDAPTSSAGTTVDPETGEFEKPDEDREPVGAGVGGGNIDPEVGF